MENAGSGVAAIEKQYPAPSAAGLLRQGTTRRRVWSRVACCGARAIAVLVGRRDESEGDGLHLRRTGSGGVLLG
jgi:hypothetical protein